MEPIETPERRADVDAIEAEPSPARAAFNLRGFATEAGLVIGGALIANVLNYAFHFILSRRLGPDAYGTLVTLLGIAAIVGVLGTSIGVVAMQETARMWAARHDRRIAPFVRRTIPLALLVGLGAGLLVALSSFALGPYVHVVDLGLWALLSVFIAVAIAANFARGAAQGAHRFWVFAASLNSEAVIKLGVAIALVWAGWLTFGALVGIVAGSLVALIVAFAPLALRGDAKEPARRDERLRLGGESVRVLLVSIATTALLFIDIVFAKHHFAGAVAGYYGAAGTIARVLPFGVGFIALVLMPKAAAAHHSHRGSLVHLLKVTFGLGLLAVALGLIVLSTMPEALIDVTYGGRFAAAVAVLPLYGVDVALIALAGMGISYLLAVKDYSLTPALLAAVTLQAVLMAAFGTTPQRLLAVAITVNALLVPVIATRIVRSLRLVSQAPSPLSAET